jgi:phospholipase/carboxylesterase
MTDHPPQKKMIDGWTFRIKYPQDISDLTQVMLLLHGHMGNENAMWILTRSLPHNHLLLAPRAPHKTGEGQYSWHEITPQWPDLPAYSDLIEQLLSRVDQWCETQGIYPDKYDLMGFSQGAVMAYAMAFIHPEKIGKVAALAGLIPQNWIGHINEKKLERKTFYIAHGTRDEMVPIKKARLAATWLEESGAEVTFCEADIGHKLSANCFKRLGKFFA